MLGLTKFSLKRPVTLILALVTVLYFGLQAVFSAPMELTPDMNMPMLVVATIYPGASPEDINELISKPVEGGVSTLSGIDTVTANSSENASIVILQYEYGTNMDTAYMDLRKSLDIVKNSLPEDAQDPTIYELDINATAAMTVSVMGGTDENLYNYVTDAVIPEIEKIESVGEVSLSGGQENFIKIELIPEKMTQYGMSISTLAQLVGAADFTIPAGNVGYGRQELSLTVANDYKDPEKIKQIPIPTMSGDVIHLEDIAVVSNTLKEKTSLSRYNSQEVVTLSVSKQQSASAVKLSKSVSRVLDEIKKKNDSFNYKVVYDSADSIVDAIKTVFETVLIAVVLAMLVLFVFFGDIKSSLIVGSSIPVSVLVTLTLMNAAGFSLNVVSVGSLALGVGMIVDNSIVVLESCFRAKEVCRTEEKSQSYFDSAIEGTRIVIGSIFGSTATTCVVFIPLALLKGLTGQLFTQLGFTIVFCMVSSFFAAVMIVPFLYYFTKPVEKKEFPVNRFVVKLQEGYRKIVSYIIPRKKQVLLTTALLIVLSVAMAVQLGFELLPNIDEGIIGISVKTEPGLKIDEVNAIATQVESFVAQQPDVDEYLLTYGGSGLSMMSGGSSISINAYLKSNRKKTTAETIKEWKAGLADMVDCTISIEQTSSVGLNLLQNSTASVNLEGTDYDTLKKTADEIAEELHNENFITNVRSNTANSAPIVKVTIDPVKAEGWGLTPAMVGSTVYLNLSGTEVLNYTSNGSEVSVRMENPDGLYDTVEGVKDMLITTPAGTVVPLGDIAAVTLEDSPRSITRTNKQYQATVSGDVPLGYEKTAQDLLDEYMSKKNLPNGVSIAVSEYNEMLSEELGSLFSAILTATFLVFIVMAMQFESPRLSLMVMFTIPFSLIGAFGLLFACNIKISMTPMLGFLMLVGTVVNNGILYVDTVNQYREDMGLDKALVEAGATRIRPILMTTLTTVLAMIPMALANGNAGELLKGLSLVNIGGLIASTLLALLLLPTVFSIFDKKGKKAITE